MKPTFCKLATVSLCSLLLFSCAKKESALTESIKSQEGLPTNGISINKGQHDYLNSIFADEKLTSSFIAQLKDSVQNLSSAKTASNYDAAYPDQFNPAYTDDAYATYEGDPMGSLGGPTTRTRYDIKIVLNYRARPVQLYVVLPFYYNEQQTSHPNARLRQAQLLNKFWEVTLVSSKLQPNLI
ncbi:hypothetical protein [[Flexibacter] sp. ATCC 35208]|uniref:hypothetical protein n=1 Tax=[Flexibacter] sp. ATCC 35208 TaxID=1936242 RepID=UPI0009D1CBFF|nr:hypothetical protein [[Flexibacter] sp. ATCC 35208]OMP79252.1 hypothetical protein BW716_10355 [[Flexibacter] sp. ATCC 35208]